MPEEETTTAVPPVGIPAGAVPAFFRDRWQRPWFAPGLILFILLGCLVLFSLVKMDGRGLWLRDFEVYQTAGTRALQGADLYRVEDGHYRYKYSPVAAFYFTPFALLPVAVAQVVYWLALSAVIVAGLYLAGRTVCPDGVAGQAARLNTALLLAAAVLGFHFVTELSLGQANQLLIVSAIAMAWLYYQDRPRLLALFWAAALFIKPVGLIFIPYFLLKRRFRELGWLALFAALLFFLPALVYQDGGEFIQQNREWLNEMAVETGNKQDLLKEGNHTLASVLVRYSPLALLQPGPAGQRVIEWLVPGALALLVLWAVRRGRALDRPAVLELALLMGLIPLLSYTSETAFGFIELALVLLLFSFKRLGRPGQALTVAGVLLYVTGNLRHQFEFAWSEHWLATVQELSLVSLGTAALLAALLANRFRGRL